MGTVISVAAGFLLAYLAVRGLRRVPYLLRLWITNGAEFLAIVALVFAIGFELTIAIRPGAPWTDILGICIILAAELVMAAWLALHVAMRMMVITVDRRQRERERQSSPHSEVSL
jgi:protein-S-isoprenylcysteine O-methyltransferase Ste14